MKYQEAINLESREQIIYSSPREFDEFMRSSIWRDMLRELKVYLEMARDGLEDTSNDRDEMCRMQGRSELIRNCIALPEVLRDSKIADLEREVIKDD